jgi:two-component system LytT family sensor kinase
MPDRLSIHAPVLVNTIGHCTGAIAFGILLYFLLLDWRKDVHGRSMLPSFAAGLALLWNVGSLIALATSPGDKVSDVIVAASFSVLSVLPAVLLHISLLSRERALWIGGYVVSALAVSLHVGDLLTGAPRFHYAAILLVTIGFAVLTTLSIIRESIGPPGERSGGRLAGAMVLFLFAISFVHFESAHGGHAWSGEAALHHAGIPLALFVLLQDYRFLLLDAFIRFLANALLAAATVLAAFQAEIRFGVLAQASRDPFYAGLAFAAACLALGLFAFLRTRTQRFVTRVVFQRANADLAVAHLRRLAVEVPAENDYLIAVARIFAGFLSAPRFEALVENRPAREIDRALAVLDSSRWGLPGWVQAAAPIRFSRGDACIVLLGSRRGGRRYLSEDLEILDRLTAIAQEHVERLRNTEMQALMSEAELRALQAQINPHFFFNSLNTLYGTIARENSEARKLVSNLAGLFRYSFAPDRGLIEVGEELSIVRAYLEIEQLRLGARLIAEIDVDESILLSEIPVLSIQPLMENAVKHGVASRSGTGFVRLGIRTDSRTVTVEISNSGPFQENSPEAGHGVGLANVRRRLALRYGSQSHFEIGGDDETTTVRFSVPVRLRAQPVH